MLSIYATSTQYVLVPVFNTEGVNPTGDIVQFAFLGPYGTVSQASEAVPSIGTTWYPGFWGTEVQSPFSAIALVGPHGGVVTLSSGSYLVVVQIFDNPERPVLFSGPMIVS